MGSHIRPNTVLVTRAGDETGTLALAQIFAGLPHSVVIPNLQGFYESIEAITVADAFAQTAL